MINPKNLQEWENPLNEKIESSGYKYITEYESWKYKLNVFERQCEKGKKNASTYGTKLGQITQVF